LNIARRLVLGTVQFGMPYGIANCSGQIPLTEGMEIIQRALSVGIDMLDTAIAYGEAEQRLGQIGVQGWRVVSKLPAPPENVNVGAWVRQHIDASLRKLNIEALYGLLLHQPAALLGYQGEALYVALEEAKRRGVVEKIGISAYGPDEIATTTDRFLIDIVQAPFNIVDRRLLDFGWLGRMREMGIEFHARSIFLQGLLLMDRTQRPASFSRWDAFWGQWHRWLDDCQISPLDACLGFVGAQDYVGRFVVGIDSLAHLSQIVSSAGALINREYPTEFSSHDAQLINPSLWSTH
jgi:aryl-alcohol dehydrogenase-like predicted oxidoreductase